MSNIIVSPEEQLYLQIMEDLNKPRGDGLKVGLDSRLHPDQIEQMKSLYIDGKKDVFLSCGRKWGKTELMGYVLYRQALLVPGSACYYVAPENSHARELMWNNNRMQKFLGKDGEKYIDRITNQDMVIRFKNGSYIRLIGSDNYMVANGLTPHIAVYDEFKGFNPRWHTEFAPNRAAKAAPLIIIGTKPRAGNKNMDQYDEVLEYYRKSPDAYVADRTTFDNPINHLPEQKKIIEQEIAQLRARGEEDVVQLEYFSKRIPGGKRAIFPMLDEEMHKRDAKWIWEQIRKDLKKMEWFCVTDPGTTTCFAGLIGCINPYTKKVYILDEIYEKDQNMTSTRRIYPRLEQLMKTYNPQGNIEDDWMKVADEAAAWYINECLDQYGVYFFPTQKHLNKKEHGLSLIKDQLIHGFMYISTDCPNLWEEMQKYAKDDKGNIPKKNDHLIDCLRYFNSAANYDMHEAIEIIRKKKDPIEEGRFRRLEDEKDPFLDNDWIDNIFSDF